MKNVHKVLFRSGKNYLSIAILTITLVGIISTSIVTDYVAQYNNIQASSISIVDVSFIGPYHTDEDYNESNISFDLPLPISHVFFSHHIKVTGCILSTNNSLTSVPEGTNSTSMLIVNINFSLFQESPFNRTIDNPNSLSNTSGVYLYPHMINMYNLSLNENFSLYFTQGNLTTQSLHNLTLLDEFALKNEIWFMQLVGLHEYYQYQGMSGIMLMDSQYYKNVFETEEGTPKLTISSTIALNFVFEKTELLEKRPSTITTLLTTAIDTIDEETSALEYYFYHYNSMFLDILNQISYKFTIFQVFIILGSFPIFLFAWWVDKTYLSTVLNSQLNTLSILQSKGVSKSEIRKKLLWKSVVVGIISWIVAVLLSQVLSWGMRSYLFENAWTIVFSINKILNTSTIILLPIGIGISVLSNLSVMNNLFHKDKDFIVLEPDLEESRFLNRLSKKRAIIFIAISLVPLLLIILPIFGIDIPRDELIPSSIISLVSVLAITAPIFFILGLIDLISLVAPKTKQKQNRNAKAQKTLKNYSRSLVVKRMFRNVKKHIQFLFMLTISLTLITQSITYNKIMEQHQYQTDLIQNGNGFRLDYQISNESYPYFDSIVQDVRLNPQIDSLVENDISMFIAKEKLLSLYSFSLINSSEWKNAIDIPWNWITLRSIQLYSELSTNGSIMVSETFLENEIYRIGDSFNFTHENIHGQPVQRRLTIIGSFSRFPLLTSTLSDPPSSTNIITDVSFFTDIELIDLFWVFYPAENSNSNYELYDLIQTQVQATDSNNSITLVSEVGDILEFEPDISYSKFLQLEAMGLGLIILMDLILLQKRQFDSSFASGYQFRMKGMAKRIIRRIYLTEFLVFFLLSFFMFIPSYAISLQSVIGLNEIFTGGLPYAVDVPFLGIVLLSGVFFIVLYISYRIIVQKGIDKTDRKKSISHDFS